MTAQADCPDPDESGHITLLTAHLAKGLEYPVVFVSGLRKGVPHHLARDREEDLEEERRLVYVAFTRAMKRLFLCRSRMRFVPGSGPMMVQPSCLSEIPSELVEWAGSGGMSRTGADRSQTMSRLGFSDRGPNLAPHRLGRASENAGHRSVRDSTTERSGWKVRSELWPRKRGRSFRGCSGIASEFWFGHHSTKGWAPDNLKLRIDFDSQGRKTVFARYARLEIVIS